MIRIRKQLTPPLKSNSHASPPKNVAGNVPARTWFNLTTVMTLIFCCYQMMHDTICCLHFAVTLQRMLPAPCDQVITSSERLQTRRWTDALKVAKSSTSLLRSSTPWSTYMVNLLRNELLCIHLVIISQFARFKLALCKLNSSAGLGRNTFWDNDLTCTQRASRQPPDIIFNV